MYFLPSSHTAAIMKPQSRYCDAPNTVKRDIGNYEKRYLCPIEPPGSIRVLPAAHLVHWRSCCNTKWFSILKINTVYYIIHLTIIIPNLSQKTIKGRVFGKINLKPGARSCDLIASPSTRPFGHVVSVNWRGKSHRHQQRMSKHDFGENTPLVA